MVKANKMAAFLIFDIQREKNLRRERIFRDRGNILDRRSDSELVERYRFPKSTILRLCNMVESDVAPKTQRSYPVPTYLQMLTTLRFLAKGDYLSEVSDLHGISKSSGCLSVQRIVSSICANLDNIKFPTTREDLQKMKSQFYKIASFPNVIGAIDGTQIPIQGMSSDDEHLYVCRKGFHSINVQAVVDHELRFTNAVCKFPGSTHDSYILHNSFLPETIESLEEGGWLLGDSGYPLKEWLMTPVANPQTPQEQRYNIAHSKIRNIVERTFGVLKARFRCIHKTGGCLPYKPEKCAKIIECVMRLHNLAINDKIPLIEDVPMETLNDESHLSNLDTCNSSSATALRQRLIQRF